MRRLATFRFFCSHNSFIVSDADCEIWNEPSEMDGLTGEECDDRLRRGWYKLGPAISYRTLAQSYDNRIDVYQSSAYVPSETAARTLVHNVSLPSGALMIFSLDYGERVQIGRGDYAVYCRAYNLGVDQSWDAEPLADADFLKRDDLERFELVLVPGTVDVEGVVSGSKTLY